MKKSSKQQPSSEQPKALVRDGIHGCLQSGEPPPPGKKLIRGLLEKYYKRFKREKDSFENPDDAQAYDDKAVELGLILPLAKGGPKIEEENVFEKLDMLPERDRKAIEAGRKASKKLTEDIKRQGDKK
jgi:hypothetical protein